MKSPRRIIAALSLLAACAATPALAAPMGMTTTLSSTPVWSLDWNPGNALAVGSVPLSTNPAAPTHFQLLFQASLGNFLDVDGNQITGTGLGSSFEVTTVMSFPEIGYTSASGTPANATFNFDENATGTNFVQMYIGAVNSNALGGTGYHDGDLFLQGHVVGTLGPGNFSTDGRVLPMDGFGTNNYPGQQTVVGNGASDVVIQVDAINQDATVITNLGIGTLFTMQMLYNTSTVTPFKDTNPSHVFYDGTGNYTPVLGPVNGLPLTGGPQDFQFQADANASFEAVPEPSTFVLAGLGLLMAGGYLRRRKA